MTTLLCEVVKLRTSALSLFSAISNEDLVRVLGSKNRLHTVTPLSAGTFFTSLSETSFMDSAVSSIVDISSAVSSSSPSMCFRSNAIYYSVIMTTSSLPSASFRCTLTSSVLSVSSLLPV